MSLLLIPAEIRATIFGFTFSDLVVCPRLLVVNSEGERLSGQYSGRAELNKTQLHQSIQSLPHDQDKTPPLPLSLSLLTIHPILYPEALASFLSVATINVPSHAHHMILTDTNSPLSQHLHRLCHLRIAHNLLPSYPPPSLLSTFPRLKSLTITNIRVFFHPREMAILDRHTPQLLGEGGHGSDYRGIDRSPGLVVFRILVASLREEEAEHIMRLFAACHGLFMLKLHFRVARRRSWEDGGNAEDEADDDQAAPGEGDVDLDIARLRRKEREFTYSFNADSRS
ncbi:hypothetical protein PV10_06844 [Exophiala mesophila]|uniref:Uncharacterized protein n=1 Tax=Exophiala mesophila TaxID=212818 RepID=A0A0D1Z6D2_EXOME|nr:uncharacterized protein PV10_06844 [Exophiala mesophila]KIV89444.1 hypothetical protein PV10_06844 [Exophiala mesophila]